MAISRTRLTEEVVPLIAALFDAEYKGTTTVWAVHADYSFEDMEWRVRKVEPWTRKHHEVWRDDAKIHMVIGAVDELAAYKKFMARNRADNSE